MSNRSSLLSIKMDKGICLSLAIAAIETFPKECVGAIITNVVQDKKSNTATAIFASPYQIARRTEERCFSLSNSKIYGILKGSRWYRLCEFHSHPSQSNEPLFTELSEYDLEDMDIGNIEVIISLIKINDRNRSIFFINTNRRDVSLRVNKFKVSIRGFRKEKGRDEYGIPNRKNINIILT